MNNRDEVDVRFDDSIEAHVGKSKPISDGEMQARVWRFDKLVGSPNAFIDAAVPGHERVLYGALGAGTADEQIVKAVKAAENFHIDFIKAGPGQGAALHSHDSEEVFIVMTGRWKVTWGTQGENELELAQFDGVSVPSGVMRSFENLGDRENVLMAIIGGKTPGHCVWSESILDKLRGRSQLISLMYALGWRLTALFSSSNDTHCAELFKSIVRAVCLRFHFMRIKSTS